MLALGAIPQLVGGTVPVASRVVFPPAPGGLLGDPPSTTRKVQGVEILITDAGAHTTFVATIEGSHDGVDFVNLAQAVKGPATGLTLDENGVGFSAVEGTTGLFLELPVAFKHYRLGLGGDNVAANGAGKIVTRSVLT